MNNKRVAVAAPVVDGGRGGKELRGGMGGGGGEGGYRSGGGGEMRGGGCWLDMPVGTVPSIKRERGRGREDI